MNESVFSLSVMHAWQPNVKRHSQLQTQELLYGGSNILTQSKPAQILHRVVTRTQVHSQDVFIGESDTPPPSSPIWPMSSCDSDAATFNKKKEQRKHAFQAERALDTLILKCKPNIYLSF